MAIIGFICIYIYLNKPCVSLKAQNPFFYKPNVYFFYYYYKTSQCTFGCIYTYTSMRHKTPRCTLGDIPGFPHERLSRRCLQPLPLLQPFGGLPPAQGAAPADEAEGRPRLSGLIPHDFQPSFFSRAGSVSPGLLERIFGGEPPERRRGKKKRGARAFFVFLFFFWGGGVDDQVTRKSVDVWIGLQHRGSSTPTLREKRGGLGPNSAVGFLRRQWNHEGNSRGHHFPQFHVQGGWGVRQPSIGGLGWRVRF